MKFSESTINVLKNFSTINQSILLKPGSEVSTISVNNTILATAKIEETFTSTAGIYDLSRFLATLSLFQDPDVSFNEDHFKISDNRKTLKYTYAAESLIKSPTSTIKLPDHNAIVSITWADIQSVIKASVVLQLPQIVFHSENGKLQIGAIDPDVSTADRFMIDIENFETKSDFSLRIKTEYMRFLPDDYTITLSQIAAKFESPKATYWVAVEQPKKRK